MKFVEELALKGKTVFLRSDLNVPLDQELNITDDNRIRASLPTIQHIVNQGAKLVLCSHLGRPAGSPVPDLSLKPVAARLEELTGKKVQLATDCVGADVESLKAGLEDGEILLLENIRFNPGETKNDSGFSKELGKGIDVFVNDAFGAAHRSHASTVGITSHVAEKAGGFTLKNEIEYFEKCFKNPKSPLVAIFGGAKVSSKLGAILNVSKRADTILIGGAMANTFFAAKGLGVGKSLHESELLTQARETEEELKKNGCELVIPSDLVVAKEFSESAETKVCAIDKIGENEMAMDIGPETLNKYESIISSASTVVWNGPMGVLEMEPFAQGTYGIVDALCQASALTVVGGGDTDLALHKKHAFDKVDYVSTGGGAFLVLLEGKELDAVAALG